MSVDNLLEIPKQDITANLAVLPFSTTEFISGTLINTVDRGPQTAPAVRFREFRTTGGTQEIFLGKANLGTGANRVEKDLSPNWNVPLTSSDPTLTNSFEFVFAPEGPETATGNGQTSLTNAGNAGAVGLNTRQEVNYLQLFVRQGANSGNNGIIVQNLSITPTNGSPISFSGSFGSGVGDNSSGNWYFHNDVLSEGFTLTGQFVVSRGTGSQSQEAPRVEFSTGYVASPDISINDVALSEGDSGNTNFNFTVTLSEAPTENVTVQYDTANGSATLADNDYVQATGQLTFTPTGALTQTITVPVIGDTTVENDETFFVNLSNPTGGGTLQDGQGIGTILNDDASISVTIGPPSRVLEDGNDNLVYTFTRTGDTSAALNVDFNVTGDAIFSTDYTQTGASSFGSTTGTVNFAAGSATATVTVDPIADSTQEFNESVILQLTGGGTNYTIGNPSSATGWIDNDDNANAGPGISVVVSPLRVFEDGLIDLVYTFTRTGNLGAALNSVNFGVGGTADPNTDYTQIGASSFNNATKTGTVNFTSGSSTATVTINPAADFTQEFNESVILQLTSRGSSYRIENPSSATGWIDNGAVQSPPAPGVTVVVSPEVVSEDGVTNLVYTFTRPGNTNTSLSVNFDVGGDATFNTDYTQTGAASFSGTTGTVNFPRRASQVRVRINPTADTTVEENETVLLTVTSGTGYTVGSPNAATGIIANDDRSRNSLSDIQEIFNLSLGKSTSLGINTLATEELTNIVGFNIDN
ncbi:Calx-beta domain-containing protein [Gloeocapsa sp. PCC 73106]|uniref:Calx-beta domain-containing protein n=1 Tax=Gloeocapsa sp. PCC 73106 TaxID=102232 RepID=UPI0002ACDA67|nr:Calx-beta domain-containing protein [Gloeocapsa sp. PCC 73106]ELR96422.1 Calx-beta domain-containing protein [Gloeocapsa sp. PCC 73106]